MERQNSNVVMALGSKKNKKPSLTMQDLERMYGTQKKPQKKTAKAKAKDTESPLNERLQAAWNGTRSVAFTPENWKPDVFSDAQSEFDENKVANIHADATIIREDLKKTLASVLDVLESGARLFFGLSATMLIHQEASAFVQRLIDERLNILKSLVKSAIEQAKKPLIVARIVFNTGCNYLGLPGHILRNFMDLVVDPVVRLWFNKQSRAKQEAFLNEAEACPKASAEERSEIAKVQSFFLSRMLAKFIVFIVDAKFDIFLDEEVIVQDFFGKSKKRDENIKIARAILMGGDDVDLKPLLGILDVLDDHSIVKIFRAVRRQLQPFVPSRKTRVLSSNIVGNLNANRKKQS